jgi:putative two-component system response regulator
MPEILVVDDEDAIRIADERLLRSRGYSCDGAANASEARRKLAAHDYTLVLLDINMPGESGMALLEHVRQNHPSVAVLMVTGEDDPGLARAASELGAFGYLVKPVRPSELLINVSGALYRRELEADNRRAMRRLEGIVSARTSELLKALGTLRRSESKLIASEKETILRLARLVEFRDEETGRHVDRMSSFCGVLARQIGLAASQVDELRQSSQLHDVGKVAVPDAILFKPGKLSDEEFGVMKGHARKGYEMLLDSPSELVRQGALIAWTHHERWNGKGYPRRLAGEDIPLEGRLAAVADVFDALTSHRVYRPAFPVRSALEMMDAERGQHFEPRLLDALHESITDIERLRNQYPD